MNNNDILIEVLKKNSNEIKNLKPLDVQEKVMAQVRNQKFIRIEREPKRTGEFSCAKWFTSFGMAALIVFMVSITDFQNTDNSINEVQTLVEQGQLTEQQALSSDLKFFSEIFAL